MESKRWLRLAPLAVALVAGTVGLVRPVAGAGGDPPWDPPPCGPAGGGGAAGTWYRLDPVLDETGTLAGRTLRLGAAGGPARALRLPPESFASGPVDGRVLVGDDDGARSRLRLVDPGRACALVVGDAADVVRSAVVTADGAILEHRVDRATREDLGLWRRRGSGAADRVLPGLRPDPAAGPTFATELVAATDGRVVVSSCGVERCRVRVLDAQGRVSALVDDLGPALGVTGRTLVAPAACPGLPCDVLGVDLASGARRTVARGAYAAVLGGRADARLVVERGGGRLAVVDVPTGRAVRSVLTAAVPLRQGSLASAGAETGPGTVALARGRAAAATVAALDPEHGRPVGLAEAVR